MATKPCSAGESSRPATVATFRVRVIGASAGDPEALELAAGDLLRDGEAREKGDAEPFTRRALHRLAGTELPDAARLDAAVGQRALDDRPRRRPGLSSQEESVRQRRFA